MAGAVGAGINAAGINAVGINAVGAAAAQGGASRIAIRAADGVKVAWQNANVSDSYEHIFRVLEPICEFGPPSSAAVELLEKTFNLPFKINRKFPINCANDAPVPAEQEESARQKDLDDERTSNWRRNVVQPYHHDDDHVFVEWNHGLTPMAVQGTIVEDLFGGAKGTPIYIDGNDEQCVPLVGGRVVARAWDPNRCKHHAISQGALSRPIIVVWFYRHRSPEEARDFINNSRPGVYVRDTAKLRRRPGKADFSADAWEDANDGTFTRPGAAGAVKPPQDCINWKLPKKKSRKWRDVIIGAAYNLDVYARAFVDLV